MGPITANLTEEQRQQPPQQQQLSLESQKGDLSPTHFVDAASSSDRNVSPRESSTLSGDEDSFTEGLDSILSAVSAGPHAEIATLPVVIAAATTTAAATVTNGTSGNVLAPPSPVLSCEQLSASEVDTSERIRKKYGLKTPTSLLFPSSAVAPEDELVMDALMRTMQQLARQFMIEGYSSPLADGIVEEAHALLPVLLATMEIALWHGIGVGGALTNGSSLSLSNITSTTIVAPPSFSSSSTGSTGVSSSLFKRAALRSPWDLLLRLKGKDMAASQALENVRQFSSLRTASARIRAWLRVTLMNKTLAPDLSHLLTHYSSLIAESYYPWAAIRSERFPAFLGLISSLDPIDFNLYIREEDIPQGDFPLEIMPRLFTPLARINFTLLGIYYSEDADDQGGGNGDGTNEPTRVQAMLADENARLRRSLMMQINQRAYFHDEYSKSQARCATLLSEQHELQGEIAQARETIRQLRTLLETHEATNEALQRQLATAYQDAEAARGDFGGQLLSSRQRESVNLLRVELENERAAHTATKAALTDICEEKARHAEQLEAHISALEERLAESEETAVDRIKVLSEQLKLANSLKEEYKKRLRNNQ